MAVETLSQAALHVLMTADPHEKVALTHEYVAAWRAGDLVEIGQEDIPDRPARPEKPELRAPGEMPKRRKAGSDAGKIALLHALAHIELNAIDLAWDIMARFAALEIGGEKLPKSFYDDWCAVADDEAKHFLLLSERLRELGAAYGDLPAHDGLWESAERTAHDFAARLAVVPMVLEARGLDVTPTMIATMKSQGDMVTADILQTIHDEEITHVRAGTRWFDYYCRHHDLDAENTWKALVTDYFNGVLKRPFNDDSREKAGMIRDWYEALAE